MKKFLIAFTFLLAACATNPFLSVDESYIVQVETDAGRGTGFILPYSAILTAKHVTAGSNNVSVTLRDGTVIHPAWHKDIPEADITILGMSQSLPEPTKTQCRRPTQGEAVYSTGNPLGASWATFRGYIASDILVTLPDGDYLVVDVGINGGMSGAPLMDQDGYVVGLVAATLAEGIIGGYGLSRAHAALVIPADIICKYVKW